MVLPGCPLTQAHPGHGVRSIDAGVHRQTGRGDGPPGLHSCASCLQILLGLPEVCPSLLRCHRPGADLLRHLCRTQFGDPEAIRPAVADVLHRCEQCCNELLDIEYRTACRRLLARCAIGNPAAFSGKASAANTAAAITWIIGKANRLFTPGGLLVKDINAHYEIASTPSQRATTLLRAGGFETDHYGGMDLADTLIKARIARGWTQRNLADALGVAEQQIQRYESTAYRSASLARLCDIAEALEVTITERTELRDPDAA